jgi:hypothetical protein
MNFNTLKETLLICDFDKIYTSMLVCWCKYFFVNWATLIQNSDYATLCPCSPYPVNICKFLTLTEQTRLGVI